jgi:flagellar biosynthetic protein FlhB
MLAGVMALGFVAPRFAESWGGVYASAVEHARTMDLSSPREWNQALVHTLGPAVGALAIVLGACFAGALFSGLGQSGGLNLRVQALQPNFKRLNPISNLGNLFSLRSVLRLVKSLIPAAIMVALGWAALQSLMMPMPVMSLTRLPELFSHAYTLALDAAWISLAWSGLDFAMEWRSWGQRLKMSKQEIREEIKEAMGNPQIKGKIRQLQNAMRRRKVKADISRASVVITNPTHYAVALEFSIETMQAPTVLAKGRDLHAAEIREEARWAGVPLVENPPLARSLYRLVEPGQSIPMELYAAVAGILAYLYQQQMEERARRERHRQQQAAATAAQYSKLGNMPGGLRGFQGGL